ncbi:hypothetical protein EXIGLDRAFT_761948 [Exidia glandulosa HHB12029]|uniref:Uncharacterized protein n=1 Tax=Exidia glandulosa HHB12029 TaxID=1314781 RepID=A0A165N1Q2_EXIGL|nr:hypothetical protein EXIGLDRAFT_761948 [Exidia glandulosa HHB12029]
MPVTLSNTLAMSPFRFCAECATSLPGHDPCPSDSKHCIIAIGAGDTATRTLLTRLFHYAKPIHDAVLQEVLGRVEELTRVKGVRALAVQIKEMKPDESVASCTGPQQIQHSIFDGARGVGTIPWTQTVIKPTSTVKHEDNDFLNADRFHALHGHPATSLSLRSRLSFFSRGSTS